MRQRVPAFGPLVSAGPSIRKAGGACANADRCDGIPASASARKRKGGLAQVPAKQWRTIWTM